MSATFDQFQVIKASLMEIRSNSFKMTLLQCSQFSKEMFFKRHYIRKQIVEAFCLFKIRSSGMNTMPFVRSNIRSSGMNTIQINIQKDKASTHDATVKKSRNSKICALILFIYQSTGVKSLTFIHIPLRQERLFKKFSCFFRADYLQDTLREEIFAKLNSRKILEIR